MDPQLRVCIGVLTRKQHARRRRDADGFLAAAATLRRRCRGPGRQFWRSEVKLVQPLLVSAPAAAGAAAATARPAASVATSAAAVGPRSRRVYVVRLSLPRR